jgi:CRISPR-associated protein Cmr1
MMELDIDHIKAEAQAITNSGLLARIDLTNITPTRIGGYNARPYSKELDLPEGLRTSEVKGIWRWWLRATLAGALWDLGKEPNKTTIKEMVNEILGSTASASKFTLTSPYAYSAAKKLDDLTKIPRMRLILMKRRDESQDEFNIRSVEEKYLYPLGSLKATLSLYEHASKPLDWSTRRIALGTLLLALLLHGIGAITRRGFGHFQLEVKECVDELRDYSGSIKAVNEARREDEMQGALNGLFNKVLQDAKQSLLQRNMLTGLGPRPSRLPPFPSLSSDSRIFRLRIVNVKASDETSLLEKLGEVAMKLGWKRSLGLNKKEVGRVSGGVLDTWILGLPREVRETGYSVLGHAGRRPSAITLAPMKKLQQSFLVAVYGFLSSDWPIGGLQWRGVETYQQVEDISGASHLLTTLNRIRDDSMRKRIKECVRQRGEARIECAFNLAFDLIERQLTGGLL